MRRYVKIIALSLAVLFGATTMSGCYGKFMLTKKIYTWNGTVSSNKFINNLVFWVMVILPVYGLGTFIDAVILNTIEFWTGSNPMAMGPGEKETKMVTIEDTQYQMTVSRHHVELVQLSGDRKGNKTVLDYDEPSRSWYLTGEFGKQKVAEIKSENHVVFLNPYETEMMASY